MKLAIFLSKILPLLFWVLLLLGFDSLYISVLTVLAAIIHECGHLIFAPISKRAALPRADISGFRIDIRDMSYKEELLAAIGGPLINIFVGILSFVLFTNSPLADYARLFGTVNVMTALSNLLPIEGYDGYKILFCIGALIFDDAGRCEAVLLWISFLLSALMCFLSLYLILKLGEGYWIFFVFFTLTLSVIIRRTKHNS